VLPQKVLTKKATTRKSMHSNCTPRGRTFVHRSSLFLSLSLSSLPLSSLSIFAAFREKLRTDQNKKKKHKEEGKHKQKQKKS